MDAGRARRDIRGPTKRCPVKDFFGRAARWTARATGHPLAFGLAALLIIVWAITGPIFGFSAIPGSW